MLLWSLPVYTTNCKSKVYSNFNLDVNWPHFQKRRPLSSLGSLEVGDKSVDRVGKKRRKAICVVCICDAWLSD